MLFRSMTSAIMETDPSGHFVGSSFMYATARDWARLGLLYLQDGEWNGERILPEGWAKYVSTPTPKSPYGIYGGQFWLNAGLEPDGSDRQWPELPKDLYFCSGYEGQHVVIVPSKNLVFVRLGLYSFPQAWDRREFFDKVLKAFP